MKFVFLWYFIYTAKYIFGPGAKAGTSLWGLNQRKIYVADKCCQRLTMFVIWDWDFFVFLRFFRMESHIIFIKYGLLFRVTYMTEKLLKIKKNL